MHTCTKYVYNRCVGGCFVAVVVQDPVAAEEGDKEASPVGLSPPQEPLPSPAVEPPAVEMEPRSLEVRQVAEILAG